MIELDRTTGADVNEWDHAPDPGRRPERADQRDRRLVSYERHLVQRRGRQFYHLRPAPGRGQGRTRTNRSSGSCRPPRLVPLRCGQLRPRSSPFLLTAVDSTGTRWTFRPGRVRRPAADFDWPWVQHAPIFCRTAISSCSTTAAIGTSPLSGPFFRGPWIIASMKTSGTVSAGLGVWQGPRRRDCSRAIISGVDLMPYTGNRLMAPGISKTAPHVLRQGGRGQLSGQEHRF